MPRLRTILAVCVLLLLFSVGATALLSDVQRLGGAVTLNPGTPRTRVERVPVRRWHRARVIDETPRTPMPEQGGARAAEPDPRPVFAPAPRYPIEALRRQRQGVVRLHLQLDASGRVRSASVEQSSGDPQLDRSALAAVRQWTFSVTPGSRRDFVMPIRFSIDTAAH